MTLAELKEKIKEVVKDIGTLDDLRKFLDDLGQKLGKKLWPSNQDLLNAKLKEYETVGNFVRHYSITRSAVLTFLVGLSFGITGVLTTKSETPEAKVVIIGLSLAFALLFIACVFDQFLYGYLRDAWGKGQNLEEKVNKELGIEGKDLKLQFYEKDTGAQKHGFLFIWKDKGDGPTICLWYVTLAYFVFGIVYTIIEVVLPWIEDP